MNKPNNTLAPNGTGNAPTTGKGALMTKFSQRFGVDVAQVSDILKNTAFKNSKGPVTNEQLAALMIVADQYNLNPFTKEIYAFPDKNGGIVPIVGVDGWIRIMNEHPQFDGMEFRYADNNIVVNSSKKASEWIEVIIYRKDRTRPIIVREYLEECMRGSEPWKMNTRRMLRHKTLIQGARLAFGFSGIYDEDEGKRIAEARVINMNQDMPKSIDPEYSSQPQKQIDQQPISQPVNQHTGQAELVQTEQSEPSAEEEFFDQEPQQEEHYELTEEELATYLGDQTDQYLSNNAAERKMMLLKLLPAFGAQQADMERLTGKGYPQWTKQDRIKLLHAYASLANGADPSEVFPVGFHHE
ncbi:phage recombination protein Bet [Maridesulfovibrio bastinii]|uniref:phage recombination protein Bet n=1 Tax=Maridesulfovibrio bastinii TaxID=47157 RepID=UPI0006887FFB